MPKPLGRLHPVHGTPAIAIIASAALYLVLSSFSFTELAEVDVLLYSAALSLEFIALVRLRRTEPALARPFRIPGGVVGVTLVAVLPILLMLGAGLEMARTAPIETVSLLAFGTLSALVIYRLRRADSELS